MPFIDALDAACPDRGRQSRRGVAKSFQIFPIFFQGEAKPHAREGEGCSAAPAALPYFRATYDCHAAGPPAMALARSWIDSTFLNLPKGCRADALPEVRALHFECLLSSNGLIYAAFLGAAVESPRLSSCPCCGHIWTPRPAPAFLYCNAETVFLICSPRKP